MSDLFDDQLRARLDSPMGRAPDARSVLDKLAPSLRRARRVAQVKTAGVGLAIVLATSGALTAGLSGGQEGESATLVATAPSEPPTSSPTSLPLSSSTAIASEQSSIVTSTTSQPGDTTSSSPQQSPAVTSAPTVVATTDAPTSIPNASTTSTPESTEPPGATSTIVDSESTVIDSLCGSIEVATTGDTITLIGVVAEPGYEVDQKNAGPETVEVSFEGPGGHCEIKAEVRDGSLWSDSSTE